MSEIKKDFKQSSIDHSSAMSIVDDYLLTLARIDGAESYWRYYQQTSNRTKIKSTSGFAKTFLF